MKIFKTSMVLLIVVLFGCEDSINGPVGSNLNYEPQRLALGEEVEFGTINEDIIKVKLSGLDGDKYILEHSNKVCEHCPLYAKNMWLEFVMCEGKYKVAFIYQSSKEDVVILQLYKYERL